MLMLPRQFAIALRMAIFVTYAVSRFNVYYCQFLRRVCYDESK